MISSPEGRREAPQRLVRGVDGTSRIIESHKFEFPYERSVGPVLGGFFAGLAEGRIVGTRTRSGLVVVPPVEVNGETTADLVEVGPDGTIVAWCWVESPRRRHPVDVPFAWALILMDGADVPMLHVVLASAREEVRTGLRVMPVWRAERDGQITDIRGFTPIAA